MAVNERTFTLYERVRDDIKAKIDSGIYGPGDRIPSENKLAELYSISRITVRSALEGLVEEGLLVKRKGSGTYVSPQAHGSSSYLTGSFTQNCRRKGLVPSTRVLGVRRTTPPADVAEALGDASGEVFELRRVRMANGRPCVLEVDYLPERCAFAAGLLGDDDSLFELLKQEGIGPIVGFDDRFGVCLADESLAVDLDCAQGRALLEVLERLSDPSGQVVYVNRQFIVTERYTHEVGTTRSYAGA